MSHDLLILGYRSFIMLELRLMQLFPLPWLAPLTAVAWRAARKPESLERRFLLRAVLPAVGYKTLRGDTTSHLPDAAVDFDIPVPPGVASDLALMAAPAVPTSPSPT